MLKISAWLANTGKIFERESEALYDEIYSDLAPYIDVIEDELQRSKVRRNIVLNCTELKDILELCEKAIEKEEEGNALL